MNWPCGHPKTPDNTQSIGKAGLRCRECRRKTARESARRCKNKHGPIAHTYREKEYAWRSSERRASRASWVARLTLSHDGEPEVSVRGFIETAPELARVTEALKLLAAAMSTPDRSGEADKTGTGLAEGESGLPEGSS